VKVVTPKSTGESTLTVADAPPQKTKTRRN